MKICSGCDRLPVMGSEGWARGGPGRRLRAVLRFVALVGALFAAPSALADMYTVNSAADDGDGVCDVLSLHTARRDRDRERERRRRRRHPLPHRGRRLADDLARSRSCRTSPTRSRSTATTPDRLRRRAADRAGRQRVRGRPGSSSRARPARPSAAWGSATSTPASSSALRARRTVVGNYIGIGAGGTVAKPNNVGIAISSGGNTIGTLTAADRNVISGNTVVGIEITVGRQQLRPRQLHRHRRLRPRSPCRTGSASPLPRTGTRSAPPARTRT